MKPTVFIGSSSEGLKEATEVKRILELEGEIECTLWNDEGVFGFGYSYLESLLKAGSMFDFGILVATKDDKTKSREEEFESPRDNVVFEFGLFMGRLGRFRSLLLKMKGAKVPSDLMGIKTASFDNEADKDSHHSLINQVKKLKAHILNQFEVPELGLLPSTSVATGFYTNFLERVCNFLRNGPVQANDKDYNSYEVQVVIPTAIQHNMQASASHYFKENGFQKHEFKPPAGRGIRTQIKEDENNPNKLVVCDIPTTLSAVYDAIEMYLPHGRAGTKEFNLIESRELNNFVSVLQQKIARDPFSKQIVKFIEYKF